MFAVLWTLVPAVPGAPLAASADGVWETHASAPAGKPAWVQPAKGQTVRLNTPAFGENLKRIRKEETPTAPPLDEITLPMPDGSFARFRIVESPVMAPELAAKFPEIKTYRGVGVDDPAASVRLDWTPAGFHAQILSPRGAVYIDPKFRGDNEWHTSYYKRDHQKQADGWNCLVNDIGAAALAAAPEVGAASTGPTLRIYRLACAATGEYTAFHGGTVALGQAAIVTAVNRVTGVYEIEFGVRLVLVANNNLLVYTNSATDPYSNGSGSAMLGQNQTTCDSVIGSANYDIGHVFSTGGGGVAYLSSVCGGSKAGGVTGSSSPTGDAFWIDYVAHEMGHQFGGPHTFNSSTSSCSGNRSAGSAYEPGSGSTIQAYAGICGSDNLQPNSDPYFLFASYDSITTVIAGSGNCSSNVATGNNAPTVNAGANYAIPASTPFTLTASGTDPDGDPLTFCWEQRDLGATQTLTDPDNGTSPLFRSFNPTNSPARTFPKLSAILSGSSSLGERLPTTTRAMNFRVTARDNRANGGGVNSDDMLVNVVSNAGPFLVTYPNTSLILSGGVAVTWNVAGTTNTPINAAAINILLSTNGGTSFPIMLASNTPNDGVQSVSLPLISNNTARVKIEGTGNIFFDISNANFSIRPGSPVPVLNAAGSTLTAEGCVPGNGAVDPDETVTVQFAIQNLGGTNTANLVATLLSTNGVALPSGPQTYGVLTAGGPAVSRPFTFLASGTCGGTITAVLQLQDGATNLGTINYIFPLGIAGGSAITNNFSSGGISVPIFDNSTTNIPIIVAGGGNISDVNVRVRLNHTYDADLILSLVHPDGTIVTLASSRGSSGNNFGSGANNCGGTFTVFDDAAGTAISAGAAPFAGSFRPDSLLSALNGKPQAGTWLLRVQDTENGDTGTISCFQLDIATQSPVCCTGGVSSANAQLANLVPSAGTLAPPFTSEVFSYSATVAFGTTNLTVTPIAANTNSAITVNGAPVTSGNPSGLINLNIGANAINTVVISQDLTATNTYALTVTRSAGSSNALLGDLVSSGGAFDPAFASNTFNYSNAVPFGVGSVTITPTAAFSNALITVNGTPVASGSPSGSIALNIGANAIATRVVAENLTATNTYTLTVTRAASITRWWDGGSANIGTDGNGTSGGGTGVWDTVTQNWDQGNALPHTAWENANSNIAFFGGTPGLITNQGVTVGGLIFTAAYTITNSTVTFAAAGSISNSATVTIASAIAGNGPITKTGVGSLTLSGTNSYTGGTVLNAGTLVVTADTQLGATNGGVTVTGAVSLSRPNAVTFSFNAGRTWTINPGAVLTWSSGNAVQNFDGILTGSGALSNSSTTGITFTNTNNDFTGTVYNGYQTTFASIGDSTNAFNLVGSNSQLIWTGGAKTFALRPFTLNAVGTGNFINNGSGALIIQQNLAITGAAGARGLTLAGSNTGSNTFAGAIADATNSVVSLTKNGSGAWALTGTNAYTGKTSVLAGTLVVNSLRNIGQGSSLGAGGILQLGYFNGAGTLTYIGEGDTSDRPVQINDYTSGTGNTGAGVILNNGAGALIFTAPAFVTATNIVNANRSLVLGGTYTGSPNEIQGIIQDVVAVTGVVSLVKQDIGTWKLSGTNTYTGTTAINGGTLLYNGRLTAGGSNVTVASGGTLGGTGTVARVVTVSSGGTLSPGATYGTLTLTTNATIASGGRLAIQLNATQSGQLAVSNALTITGATLTIITNGVPEQPVYVIATYGTLSGTFGVTNGVPAGYVLNYNYNSANQIALVGPDGMPPVITAQPAAQDVCSGSTAAFNVTATGATLALQWQRNSSDVVNGGHYSGATTSNLIVSTADGGDVGNFRCVVSNIGGSVTSSVAALTLQPATQITGEPTAANVCAGGTAQFSVTANGAGNLSFQWQKNTLDLSNGGHYSGVTSNVLTIANADNDDAAGYRCVVTADCGSVTSSTGALTLVFPVLAVSPASLNFGEVPVGATASNGFTVSNVGCGTLNVMAATSGAFGVTPPAFTVGAGNATNVTVTFTPVAGGGDAVDVVFSSNGGASTNPVSGTGVTPPVGSFTASATSGVVQLTVNFTDTSTGAPTSWVWDFGDASTSTSQNPAHSFAPGTWIVSLVASNATGASSPATKTITVITAQQSWEETYGVLADDTDSDGDGESNLEEFLAGFNPTNSAAYAHIISVTKSGDDLVITHLGANGDTTYAGGPDSRTNVLEFTTSLGNPSGFSSLGLTNILSGGTGMGVVTNFVEPNGLTFSPSRYYRVRVLAP